MIRQATYEDIPMLLEIADKFTSLAKFGDHVGYNREDTKATLKVMIDSPSFVIFVGVKGAIGGVIAPHPFNYKQLMADEMFWWSEGREGLALLKAYEDWVTAQGGVIRMTALEAVNPERTARILMRKGYKPIERSFMKV